VRPDLGHLVRAIGASVSGPVPAARRLLGLDLPLGVVVQALVAVSILGALVRVLAGGGAVEVPASPGTGAEVMRVGPAMLAAALALGLALTAWAFRAAGRALGGQATYRDTLLVLVWIEVLALAVSLVQVVAILALPFAAPLVGLLGLVVTLWCLICFLQVAHGFPGPGRAALTVLLGALGLGFVLVVMVAALGGAPDV
jgi:hypothetical protein